MKSRRILGSTVVIATAGLLLGSACGGKGEETCRRFPGAGADRSGRRGHSTDRAHLQRVCRPDCGQPDC